MVSLIIQVRWQDNPLGLIGLRTMQKRSNKQI